MELVTFPSVNKKQKPIPAGKSLSRIHPSIHLGVKSRINEELLCLMGYFDRGISQVDRRAAVGTDYSQDAL